MKRIHLRAVLVGTLVIALTATSSATSFIVYDPGASAEFDAEAIASLLATSGTLTGTGSISINGNPAQSGATVLSGSVISTGGDGNATIDLGPLGRVVLRPDTTIVLNFTDDSVAVTSRCQQTSVEVTRGQAEIKSPQVKTLSAGDRDVFSGGVELTTAGGTDVILSCKSVKLVSFVGPGLGGVFALIGVAAGIAIGIILGSNDPSVVPPELSPVAP